MRRAIRALLATHLTLALASLAACGGDDADEPPKPIDDIAGQEALLTITDVGAAYGETPDADGSDATGETGGNDCLSRATEDFEALKGATEVQSGFNKLAGVSSIAASGKPANPRPAEALQVGVISKFSSFNDADRPETALDELRGALQDCSTASFEQGTGSVSFDISVDDDETDDTLDQQVNITLDGEIKSERAQAPFTIKLHYFRVDNHFGALNVSVIGPGTEGKDAELGEQVLAAREKNLDTEVQRLLGKGVEKFLGVAVG